MPISDRTGLKREYVNGGTVVEELIRNTHPGTHRGNRTAARHSGADAIRPNILSEPASGRMAVCNYELANIEGTIKSNLRSVQRYISSNDT